MHNSKPPTLDPMEIIGMPTYVGFFDLPGFDFYTVSPRIDSPGAAPPIVLDFKYDCR